MLVRGANPPSRFLLFSNFAPIIILEEFKRRFGFVMESAKEHTGITIRGSLGCPMSPLAFLGKEACRFAGTLGALAIFLFLALTGIFRRKQVWG